MKGVLGIAFIALGVLFIYDVFAGKAGALLGIVSGGNANTGSTTSSQSPSQQTTPLSTKPQPNTPSKTTSL